MSFTADFSKYTNYNEQSNALIVRFAAGAPCLETEVNELQLISDKRFRDIGKLFGDGLYGNGTISYTDNKLKITNFNAIVSGYMFYISTLEIALVAGETAYLEVYVKEVNLNDELKKYGNEQEVGIKNYIVDSRFGKEVSRRKILCYNLVKKTGVGGHIYYRIGSVAANGIFSLSARKINPNVDFDFEGNFRRLDLVEQEFRQVQRDVHEIVAGKQIIASRVRDPNKPKYDSDNSPLNAMLRLSAYSGKAYASVLIDSTEYDAENITDKTTAGSVAEGDIIIGND